MSRDYLYIFLWAKFYLSYDYDKNLVKITLLWSHSSRLLQILSNARMICYKNLSMYDKNLRPREAINSGLDKNG